MATQLLVVGVGEAFSDEFALDNTTMANIALNNAEGSMVPSGASVVLEMKDPAGKFFGVYELQGGTSSRGAVIFGPGTFRVRRVAGGPACGVFRG